MATGTVVAKPKAFKGSGSGATTVTGVGLRFSSSSAGTFNGSHMGKGSYTILATQLWGPSGACPGQFIQAVVTGTATLVAANGDSVSGGIAGTRS